MKRDRIYRLISDERDRQESLVGSKFLATCATAAGMNPSQKLSVLTEEVGEVARVINDGQDLSLVKEELVQVAAVAVAWLESLGEDGVSLAEPAEPRASEREVSRETVENAGEKRAGKLSLTDRILVALHHRSPLTREAIGYYTGISLTSGSAAKAYRELLDRELIDETPRGYVMVKWPHDFEPPRVRSREGLLMDFYQREGGLVADIVRRVVQVYLGTNCEELVSREYLFSTAKSERTGRSISLTSGSAARAFRRVLRLGILEAHGRLYRPSEWFRASALELSVGVYETKTGDSHRVVIRTGSPHK